MCNTRCPLDDGYDGRGYWPGLSAILSSATGNTQEMQWSEISFLVYQQSSNEVRIRKKSHQNISILFSVYLKWFIYRYLKTNINCGNAGTNVLHFTPVKNITQIVFVLVYHFVYLQDVQWTFTVLVNGCTHLKMYTWSRRDWQKSANQIFLSSVQAH